MNKMIALPAATGERLTDYQRRIAELQTVLQVTVATAAETLSVPQGWQFDLQRMAFVAPVTGPDAPVEEGPDEG